MSQPNGDLNQYLMQTAMQKLAVLERGVDQGFLDLLPYNEKSAFLPATDPAFGGQQPAPQGGAAGGAAGGAQGGAMPPGGADPSGGGGGAPPPPAPSGGDSGGGGGMSAADVQQIVMNLMMQHGMMGGGAGGAGGKGQKPFKFDEGFELHRINRLLAKVIDHLGIPIGAEDMIGQEMNYAQGGAPGQGMGGQGQPQPGAGGGGGIGPMQPMPAAKTSSDLMSDLAQRTDATLMLLNAMRG